MLGGGGGGGGGLIFVVKEISVQSGNKYMPLPIKAKERNLNKRSLSIEIYNNLEICHL